MTETKQLAHTAEEIDEILETGKRHCANEDAHVCAEDKTRWNEATNVVKGLETDILNVIDACCDTEIVSGGNYNLLKISEVSFSSRLQDNAEEIVSSTATNAVTGWFPVEYGKYYTLSVLYNGSRVSMLIASTNWLIRRIQIKMTDGSIAYHNVTSNDYSLISNNNGKKAIQIPYENAVAMRIHLAIGANDISTADKLEAYEPMIIEGDSVAGAYDESLSLDYLNGDTEVPTETNYIIKSDNRKADKVSLSPYYRDVNFGVLPFTYFHGLADSYEDEGFSRNTQYADFIALWKSLVANHSNYVTETELGTASDGQTIYMYDFKPARIPNQNKPTPKIIIIAGQHGGERCNIFGLYYFVSDLLNKWNQHPSLEYLRNHVELMIVPVVNTYGFDNLTYKNANEVNINRNFNSDWVLVDDTTSLQYGGKEPFDQPESQIIRDLILNNDDALLIIDSHNRWSGVADSFEELTYYGVCTNTDDYYNRMLDVVSYQLSSVSANYNLDYNLEQPDVIMGYLAHGQGNGLLRSWVCDNGCIGVLVEGHSGFPNDTASHTGRTFKANEEQMVNYIITAMNYLGK